MAMKWPTPFEWGTLALASAALVVSLLSYYVAYETESAQQEHLRVDCDSTDTIEEFVKEGDHWVAGASWRASITNNSRSAVNVAALVAYYQLNPNEQQLFFGRAADKRGADHWIGEHNFSIEPAKSTSIGFSGEVPVSTQAVRVPGVTKAKTIADANEFLKSLGIDLFGDAIPKDPTQTSVIGRSVILKVTTSRGTIFEGKCSLSEQWMRVVP
jgi:hypothetical protein